MCVLFLDSETANRLEVVSSLNPNGGPSLLSALNFCQTAAGKRLLRSNLLEPMTDVEAIRQRLDAVEELTSRPTDLHQPIKVRIQSHQQQLKRKKIKEEEEKKVCVSY
jgi:DNA mismatch repair ATPase MutS